MITELTPILMPWVVSINLRNSRSLWSTLECCLRVKPNWQSLLLLRFWIMARVFKNISSITISEWSMLPSWFLWSWLKQNWFMEITKYLLKWTRNLNRRASISELNRISVWLVADLCAKIEAEFLYEHWWINTDHLRGAPVFCMRSFSTSTLSRESRPPRNLVYVIASRSFLERHVSFYSITPDSKNENRSIFNPCPNLMLIFSIFASFPDIFF